MCAGALRSARFQLCIRMSKMAIEINVRIVSMLHAYVENSNQGPLCFALFAFVTISKVNLKRFQSKHTGDRSVGGYRFSKTIPKLRSFWFSLLLESWINEKFLKRRARLKTRFRNTIWKHDLEHDLEDDWGDDWGAIWERVVVFSNAYRFS